MGEITIVPRSRYPPLHLLPLLVTILRCRTPSLAATITVTEYSRSPSTYFPPCHCSESAGSDQSSGALTQEPSLRKKLLTESRDQKPGIIATSFDDTTLLHFYMPLNNCIFSCSSKRTDHFYFSINLLLPQMG